MDISLLDANFDPVGDPLTTYGSLSYASRWFEDADMMAVFPLNLPSDLSDPYAVTVFEPLTPLVDRAVPGSARYLRISDEYTYVIQTFFAKDELKLIGSDLSSLLSKVAITEVENLAGTAEEIARYLVTKYALSGIQAIPKLALPAAKGYTMPVDITTERGALGPFIRSFLNERKMSYKMWYSAADDAVYFEVLQCADRTQTQAVNTPVAFASDDGTLDEPEYKKSIVDYYNQAIVCDEDPDSPTTVVVDQTNGEDPRTLYVSGSGVDKSLMDTAAAFVLVGNHSTVGRITSSSAGTVFTDRVITGYTSFWAADSANSKYIVGGPAGKILTSEDAINYTEHTLPVSDTIQGAVYHDGEYVLTGNNYKILTSSDLTTWVQRMSGTTGIVTSPVWAVDRFMAFARWANRIYLFEGKPGAAWSYTYLDYPAGEGATYTYTCVLKNKVYVYGAIRYSGVMLPVVEVGTFTDGVWSWEHHELPALSGYSILAAVCNGQRIVIAGQTNLVAYSDNGLDFTLCAPTGGTPDYITGCYGNGAFHLYSATTKHHAWSFDGAAWGLEVLTVSMNLVDAVAWGESPYMAALKQKGVEALQDHSIVEELTGVLTAENAPVYGVDYFDGDLVDTIDGAHGIIISRQIAGVENTRESGEQSTRPVFGKEFLNTRKLISKEVRIRV